MSYMRLVYGIACPKSLLVVAQQLEHPTRVQKIIGSIPVGDSDFFSPMLIPQQTSHLSYFITELEQSLQLQSRQF